jgi:hypothetical protein
MVHLFLKNEKYMKTKYTWAVLLAFFEKQNYFRNGLTIPFLIGAVELLENKKMSISELTEELMDKNNENLITIMRCGNIGEFVIGIMDNETKCYYNMYPKNVIKSFDNLSITDSSLDDYHEKNELITLFENLYKDNINRSEYSKNAGEWTNFIPVDLERIENYKKAAANKV